MKIDHITFVAKTLEQAQRYAEERFGVALPVGGRHPMMGTHNLLTKIAPDVFLEFIAIDPEAIPPNGGRWFALDRLEAEDKLNAEPRLYSWVASLNDLEAKVSSLTEMETMSITRGEVRWNFCLRKDREAEAGGVFPALIEWEGISPASQMLKVGITLRKLSLSHPKMSGIHSRIQLLGWKTEAPPNQMVQFETGSIPSMHLELQTPKGLIVIEGGNL